MTAQVFCTPPCPKGWYWEGQEAWADGDGDSVSTSQGQAVLPDTASWAYWFGWIFTFFYVSQVTFEQQRCVSAHERAALPWEVRGRQLTVFGFSA